MHVKLCVAAKSIIKSGVTLYMRGDVVSILPKGASFGRKETLPNFARISITDADSDFLEKLKGNRHKFVLPANEDPILLDEMIFSKPEAEAILARKESA